MENEIKIRSIEFFAHKDDRSKGIAFGISRDNLKNWSGTQNIKIDKEEDNYLIIKNQYFQEKNSGSLDIDFDYIKFIFNKGNELSGIIFKKFFDEKACTLNTYFKIKKFLEREYGNNKIESNNNISYLNECLNIHLILSEKKDKYSVELSYFSNIHL